MAAPATLTALIVILAATAAALSPLPCPPCHCGADGFLDCSSDSSAFSEGIGFRAYNLSGFPLVSLEGALLAAQPPRASLPQLPALQGVHELILRYNHISDIQPSAFIQLEDLVKLDLSHNDLTAESLRADVLRGRWRPESYEPLPVEVLDLSFNALHSLGRRALEHLPRLRELRLDGNPLGVLDHNTQAAISNAPALQVLSLSACGLRVLAAGVLVPAPPHGPALRALDLSANLLRGVPPGLPSTLHRLRLDGNPIRQLPDADSLVPPFLHLEELQELSVSFMPELRHLSAAAFFGLPNLRALTCTDNPALTDIQPAAFSHMGPSWALAEVTLRNNSLQSIPTGLLAWKGMTYLDLSDNPWHCSCNFSHWAADVLTQVNLNNRGSYRCASPDSLAGRELWSAWNRTLPCLAEVQEQSGSSSGSSRGPSRLTSSLLVLSVLVTVWLVAARYLRRQRYRQATRQGHHGSTEHIFYTRAPSTPDLADLMLPGASFGLFLSWNMKRGRRDEPLRREHQDAEGHEDEEDRYRQLA